MIAPAFRDNYKWRFSQGAGTFFADIKDEVFLADVARHREEFGSGDALRAEVEVRTTREPEGLTFSHTILRVMEHIRGGTSRQIPLGLP